MEKRLGKLGIIRKSGDGDSLFNGGLYRVELVFFGLFRILSNTELSAFAEYTI
jgi:hypothetical protein